MVSHEPLAARTEPAAPTSTHPQAPDPADGAAERPTLHQLALAAIAAQLEIAEAEQAALEDAEAQRQAELARLRQELTEERLRRDLLQHRVETVRKAAADLFGFEQQAHGWGASQAYEAEIGRAHV